MPTQPKNSNCDLYEVLMLRQRMRAEHQPCLFTLKNPMNERLDIGFQWRQLLGEGFYRKVLHAENLINRQTGKDFLMINDQHAPLLAMR